MAKRNKVNTADINDIIIRGNKLIKLHAIILLIRRISLSKLIDGGAAILQTHNRNHHNAIEGIICRNPLQIRILREDTRSNAIFVKQNMPDEHSPWATIKAKHPDDPVVLPTIIPPIIRLMWATEE
jgi:hypothetical protein